MKRVLVISWFYPPINSSEGLVTYKLLKNSKLEYDICMQANTDSWSYGKDDNFPETYNVHKIYAKSAQLNEWVEEVTMYFNNHKDEYDIVMTRSMPPESHKIGLNIKKIKPSVKWIASFGDPIANNPFVLKQINAISPYSLENRYLRPMGLREMLSVKRVVKNILWKRRNEKEKRPFRREQELEKEIVANSDFMIMNSSEQKEYMLGSYDENIRQKAIILPHSFDRSMYGNTVVDDNRAKKKIVYIGHLDDIRTPHAFLEAIKELKDEVENLYDYVEVLFYGNMSAREKLYLIDNELLDIVKVKKPVTYMESLRIMQDADWLLHVDANLQEVLEHNIFFAAKLADYIGSKTPIMGVTMTEGPSAEILRNLNALIMSYSVDEIKSYLYLILFEEYTVSMNEQVAEKYNARNVAKEFDRFVQNMK